MRLAALFAIVLATPAFAGVVPPVPRGVDLGKWKEGPEPKEKDSDDEDPAAILDRIAKNAEDVGDRLKEKDTGADTREKQEQLLKDIDKLLKPPPPMDGGSSNNPPPPMGGGSGNEKQPPPTGNSGSGMPPPNGGSQGSGKPRPQRSGSKPEPMNGSTKPMKGMNEPGGMGEQPGGTANANPMGKAGGNAALPQEDPFTKQIWGHLPERLRQQASQYYREQYMPKYSELLKLYYSNLAEREKK